MTLHDLGFSELQETAYRALLADPYSDVRTVATLAGTDEHTVRTALAGLAELGAIRRDVNAPAGFSTGNPAAVIGDLIERMEDETLRRQRRIGTVRAEVPELLALQRGCPPVVSELPAGVETVTGLAGVREKLAELSFFANSSVWSVQPTGPHSPAALTAAAPLDQRGLRRGMDMRIIYDETLLASERCHATLRQRVSAGTRIRVRHGPLQRLIIMDERVAVVPADRGGRGDAVVVWQAGLLHGLCELFRQSWDGAQEVPPSEAGKPDLSEDDRTLLGLLATGTTDEIAARKTGVSVRQFRRRVASLMGRLGADSRFQAGVVATRRGWVWAEDQGEPAGTTVPEQSRLYRTGGGRVLEPDREPQDGEPLGAFGWD